MRYSVSSRQPYSVIKKADEIRFIYADRDKIFDLIENYSDKAIILDVPNQEEDWDNWQMYSEKFAEFYIALHDLSRADAFNVMNIKWFWPFPITSFYELSMIIDLRPSYIMLGPPLSFDLEKVQKVIKGACGESIPVRMTANVAYPKYLSNEKVNGLCGQWVRPEDVALYEPYIQCFDFEGCQSLKEEEVLLTTYQAGVWPGNLNLLIKRLDFNVDNRAIPEEVGPARINCGQKCWSGSGCKLCVSAFMFAEAIRKERDKRRQQSAVENL